MEILHVSNKGQITLPSRMRRRLGIASNSTVEIDLRDAEIVIRPIKTIRDVKGIFHDAAKGKSTDWETIRRQTEEAVAQEVANEDKR